MSPIPKQGSVLPQCVQSCTRRVVTESQTLSGEVRGSEDDDEGDGDGNNERLSMPSLSRSGDVRGGKGEDKGEDERLGDGTTHA